MTKTVEIKLTFTARIDPIAGAMDCKEDWEQWVKAMLVTSYDAKTVVNSCVEVAG